MDTQLYESECELEKYEEDAMEKYEFSMNSPDQITVLRLKKDRFPTLADAVDFIAKAARRGRAHLEPGDLGGAPFPRMALFSYGNSIIGGGVLLEAEVELDAELRPMRHTLAFDGGTLALYSDPFSCAEFKQLLREDKENGYSAYDLLQDFCFDPRIYPAGDGGSISLGSVKRFCGIDPQEIASMVPYICRVADMLDIAGLESDPHQRIRLSGGIKVVEHGLSEDELGRFGDADLPCSAKAEDYRGGKAIVLGEFDAQAREVILYVQAIMLVSAVEEQSRGERRKDICAYKARLFSVLAHELFHAFHFAACGERHWRELQPSENETLHKKCRRLERLCVAESLATAFAYICCLYRAINADGEEECGPAGRPHMLAARKTYSGLVGKPVPGWPYAGMKLMLRRWQDRPPAEYLWEFERGYRWRHYNDCWEWKPVAMKILRLLRRPKGPYLEKVFELSLKNWDEAYRHMTKRDRI